ncbi:hypothetical protein KKD70_03445 [Patescibacteria group bacterium]|nr:hypothetical protein [Patescibacteria group bacterium]
MNTKQNNISEKYLDGTLPLIRTSTVNAETPTVLEFVTQVRKESLAKSEVNEKCQLIVDDVRYSIAVVFKDMEDRYVLIGRESIKDNEMANSNNRKDELARLEGLDFPLASRGILPDSSFKVKNSLDNARIQEIQFIGIANERPIQELDAKDDSSLVLMPCYEATISAEEVDSTISKNGRILTAEEVLELDTKQCSSKVLELQKHLQAKQRWLDKTK